MKKHAILALLLVSITRADARASNWQMELKFGDIYDNFLQAPDGRPKTNVLAGVAGVGIDGPVSSRNDKLRLFASVDSITYDRFDPSGSVGGGLRYDGNLQFLELSLGYYWNSPRFDIGDAFDVADGVQFGGRYSNRLSGEFQVSGYVEILKETYKFTDSKDNTLARVGAALRYRGWDYGFSPELGLDWGWRDTVDDNDDFSQRDFYIKVRSLPVPSLYLSGRYRYRSRAYSIEDLDASNIGREDSRHQLSIAADIELSRLLTLNLYYAFQDADSTKPSRIFTTQLVTFGLTLGL